MASSSAASRKRCFSSVSRSDAEPRGDSPFAGVGTGHGRIADFERQLQHALVAAPKQRQGAMGRNFLERFPVVEVVAELGPFFGLVLDYPRAQHGVVPKILAQAGQQFGVLGELFHQDLPRPVESRLDVGNAAVGIDEAGSQRFRRLRRIVQESVSQRRQAGFTGDLGPGAALGLVRQVEVFQPGLGIGGEDGGFQVGTQLALLADAGEDDAAPFFEFAQITQPFLQQAQLRVVQPAGGFLAVAGDEGHCGTAIQQGDGGFDLAVLNG